MHLVVTRPFAGHVIGQRITDPAEIERLRAEQSASVVAVAGDFPAEEPAPDAPQSAAEAPVEGEQAPEPRKSPKGASGDA